MAPRTARRPPRRNANLQRVTIDALADGDEWRDHHISGDVAGAACDSLTIADCEVHGMVFTGAVLDHLRVNNVVFDACDFSGVIADEAQFTQCEFHDCRLDGMVSGRTRWHDVALVNSSMRGASMRFTNWQRAHIDRGVLRGIDFSGATMAHTTFDDGDLREALFWQADLVGVAVNRCTMEAVRGGLALRGLQIDHTNVFDVAIAVFEELGITISDR